MRKYGWLLLVLLLSSWVLADGFREQLRKALAADDPKAVERVLKAWKQATPRDPDLYVARFNWLLSNAKRMELRGGKPTDREEITIRDKKGKEVGSIGQGYDPDLIRQADAALTKGLSYAPNRLDMHFGLAKMYEMTGQPTEQLRVLRHALATHPANGKPWRWRDGAALPDLEARFVPVSLEAYAGFYWQQEGDAALAHGRAIAELLEQYYPQSSFGPFNMGVYYAMKNQPALAYPKLQRADALAPNDPSTISNLTKLAIELKRKADATRYLQQLRKLPDTQQAVAEYSQKLRKL